MKEIWMWFVENYEIVIALSIIYGFFKSLRKSITKDVIALTSELKEIKCELKSIDQRLFRLEGAFEERGRWESRRTGTERK